MKTLSDPHATDVNFAPEVTTTTMLIGLPYPEECGTPSSACPDNVREAPTELQTFTVRANTVGWKLEPDMDIHYVISDLSAPGDTMIVELPSPACFGVCESLKRAEIGAARQKIINCIGTPTSTFTTPATPIVLDITGVGFFDRVHGQIGVAPNGIELHPVLDVTFVSGPPQCQN